MAKTFSNLVQKEQTSTMVVGGNSKEGDRGEDYEDRIPLPHQVRRLREKSFSLFSGNLPERIAVSEPCSTAPGGLLTFSGLRTHPVANLEALPL